MNPVPADAHRFPVIPPVFREKEIQGSAFGFSLIEMLVALFILTFGILAAAQMMVTASNSASLAGSKTYAALAARNRLEMLEDLYRRFPSHIDLAPGTHGPEQVEVLNPNDNSTIDRFSITWDVSPVIGIKSVGALEARNISVIATPSRSDGSRNQRSGVNKTVSLTAMFSPRILP